MANVDAGSSFFLTADVPSTISFQWLSFDIPVKYSVPPKIVGINNVGAEFKLPTPEEKAFPLKMSHFESSEDDWRYLAVTCDRLSVVSCSDASLTIQALVLPYRLWFDVALLVPLASPVLSLQHLIVPHGKPLEGTVSTGNAYVVISGATDGSVAFWDLTETIEAFMQRLATSSSDKLVDCPKQPRTGRGSQGGRWWRSLGSGVSRYQQRNGLLSWIVEEESDEKILEHCPDAVSKSEKNAGDLS